MNRYDFSTPAEPRVFPKFCLHCENLADTVHKSGLCLKHILESRLQKNKEITIILDSDIPAKRQVRRRSWFNWS